MNNAASPQISAAIFPVEQAGAHRRQVPRRLWLATAVVLLAGCGNVQTRSVDADLARETLVKTLEHWQNGGEATECQSWTPPVVVGHSRWQDGAKLSGFKLADARAFDANLFVNVELQVSQAGRSETITEQYCVSTTPVLTVFRTMPPAF